MLPQPLQLGLAPIHHLAHLLAQKHLVPLRAIRHLLDLVERLRTRANFRHCMGQTRWTKGRWRRRLRTNSPKTDANRLREVHERQKGGRYRLQVSGRGVPFPAIQTKSIENN